MSDNVICVEEVSKKFSRALRQMMAYVPRDVVRSIIGLNRSSTQLRKSEFWAVDRVSFELQQGDRLGLIGRNGSGKSTLLKLLNGILLPDNGIIRIKGRVGALIEVGAGFHPMLTGKENIFVNGAILGIEQRELRKKFDEIVSFAEIGDFLESPVKFYSSGMSVRLGFAVAVSVAPEILLIDEVLAVGDFAFQKKCFDRLEKMVDKGTTIVVVSHSMATVQRLCPKALFMRQGKGVFLGDSREASAKFYESLSRDSGGDGSASSGKDGIFHKSEGVMDVYITGFRILNEAMLPVQRIASGSFVRFVLEVCSRNGNEEQLPRIAVRIMDAQTEELIANIQTPQRVLRKLSLKDRIILECDVPSFNLAPGMYKVEVKLGGDGEDLRDIALIGEPLEINWSGEIVDNMSYKGKVYLPGQWRIGKERERQEV
jgi:ABC-type polysaccharide/polyol phosphate transport system ATPase subunit